MHKSKIIFIFYHAMLWVPLVLWRCWLGGRKGIRPVKFEWWGAGMVICLDRGADLHMPQLMPLPLTVSCFSKIQIGFTFLVPAHLGSPGQRAVKRVCVCVPDWTESCKMNVCLENVGLSKPDPLPAKSTDSFNALWTKINVCSMSCY